MILEQKHDRTSEKIIESIFKKMKETWWAGGSMHFLPPTAWLRAQPGSLTEVQGTQLSPLCTLVLEGNCGSLGVIPPLGNRPAQAGSFQLQGDHREGNRMGVPTPHSAPF